MDSKTSVQISKETKDRLDKIGHKGDTYDDIIQRLLKEVSDYDELLALEEKERK